MITRQIVKRLLPIDVSPNLTSAEERNSITIISVIENIDFSWKKRKLLDLERNFTTLEYY